MKRFLLVLSLIPSLLFSQYLIDTIPGGVKITNVYNGVVNNYTNSTCMFAHTRNGETQIMIYNQNGGEIVMRNPATAPNQVVLNGITYANSELLIEALSQLTIFQCNLGGGDPIIPIDYSEKLDSINSSLIGLLSIPYDTSQVDTNKVGAISDSLYIQSFEQTYKDSSSIIIGLLNNILSIPFDTSQIDTSMAGQLSDSLSIQALEQTYKDSTSEVIKLLNEVLSISFDTTQIDTSLINYIAQFDRNNDTLSRILQSLNSKSDTVYIGDDSLNVYVLNSQDQISDSTYIQELRDSLTAQNEVRETQLDSIISLLQKDTSSTDTVYLLEIDTVTQGFFNNAGTLTNCENITINLTTDFTGSIVLNGITYDAATLSRLNTSQFNLEGNGKKISDYDYDFTGATTVNSVHVTAVGCSACYKKVPLLDCETNEPIVCEGWQSVSGVWHSASGCWE